MKLVKHLFWFSIISLSFISSLDAQSLDDKQYIQAVEKSTIALYLKKINQAPFYNGKVYRPDLTLDEMGHSLFINNQYVKGVLNYNGLSYNDIYLMYDLVLDQLIVLNMDKVGGIIVPAHHVKSFSLHNHHFINLNSSAVRGRQIEPGYYDLLYDGKIKLLVKRIKEIEETVTSYKIKRTVLPQNKYFLLKDSSSYIPFKGKKDLLKQLNNASGQVNKYLKTKKLNFRADEEKSILDLVIFYDSLK